MISHSIDFDVLAGNGGVTREAFLSTVIREIFLSASHILNTVDTRAGDSGAAVVITQDEKKVLIGTQVAIMLSIGEKRVPSFSTPVTVFKPEALNCDILIGHKSAS